MNYFNFLKKDNTILYIPNYQSKFLFQKSRGRGDTKQSKGWLHLLAASSQSERDNLMFLSKGYVNEEFLHTQACKDEQNPYYIVQAIDQYCNQVEWALAELESAINLPRVNYFTLAARARRIESESLCIGAAHVQYGANLLIQACKTRHKQTVSQDLSCLKNEYSNTKRIFDNFVQMELDVIKLELENRNGD